MGDEQAAVAGDAGHLPDGVAGDDPGQDSRGDGLVPVRGPVALRPGVGDVALDVGAEIIFTTFTRDGRAIQFPVQQPPGKRYSTIRKTTKRRISVLLKAKAEAQEFFLRFPEIRGKHWFRIPSRNPESLRRVVSQTGLFSATEGWVTVVRGDQSMWLTMASEDGFWWADGTVWMRGPNGVHMKALPTRPKKVTLRDRLEELASTLDLEDL